MCWVVRCESQCNEQCCPHLRWKWVSVPLGVWEGQIILDLCLQGTHKEDHSGTAEGVGRRGGWGKCSGAEQGQSSPSGVTSATAVGGETFAILYAMSTMTSYGMGPTAVKRASS